MATEFEILIIHKDSTYASQASQAAFRRVDELEQELSYFIPNSDIGRLNSAAVNKPVALGIDVFRCLQLCQQYYQETEGAFNVLYQSGMENPFDYLDFNAENFTVIKRSEKIEADLGGFGKGYAVDAVSEILKEWEVNRALIHGGNSSVLSLNGTENSSGWPLTMHHPNRAELIAIIQLEHAALSASGLQKGDHIVDTRSDQSRMKPVAVWIYSKSAAVADALSTAMMLMSPKEIRACCNRHAGTGVLAVYKEAEIKVFGECEIFNLDE